MKLSIIIVNFNMLELTKALVDSLLSQKLPNESEIIVVDNASRDDSVPFLRSDYPDITIIANNENRGLAAGVNTGLQAARGEYILLLNPDMIALPGSIATLVAYMQNNPDIGMAGGKLVSPNGKLQYSCFRFYTPMTIVYRRTFLGRTQRGKRAVRDFLMKDYDHKKPKDVDWLMGSCLCVRREVVDQIGGMDEQFFLYFEDVDWCRRVWDAGWRVTYVPDAIFSHFHQRSSEGGILNIITNRAIREHLLSAFKYFWKFRAKA